VIQRKERQGQDQVKVRKGGKAGKKAGKKACGEILKIHE
jgi:hypothetical protein